MRVSKGKVQYWVNIEQIQCVALQGGKAHIWFSDNEEDCIDVDQDFDMIVGYLESRHQLKYNPPIRKELLNE